MNRATLTAQIFLKQSYLCVGLDTDPVKIPAFLRGTADPVFEFNKRIIDATRDRTIAYKINTAFYEAMGVKGWESMEKTVHYIPENIFRIADAKRGDIGNTSHQYARAFFETLPFDAVTVSPYMGEDSVRPFLEYDGKWAIVLGLTSNPGAVDFELLDAGGTPLYQTVLRKVCSWGTPDNIMFVVGATQSDSMENIRKIVPDHFLLVPGIGTQGGDLGGLSKVGLLKGGGLLVNASRAVIYASSGEDFAEKAAGAVRGYADEMKDWLRALV